MIQIKVCFISPKKLFRRVECLSDDLKTESRFEQNSWRKLILKFLKIARLALRAAYSDVYVP